MARSKSWRRSPGLELGGDLDCAVESEDHKVDLTRAVPVRHVGRVAELDSLLGPVGRTDEAHRIKCCHRRVDVPGRSPGRIDLNRRPPGAARLHLNRPSEGAPVLDPRRGRPVRRRPGRAGPVVAGPRVTGGRRCVAPAPARRRPSSRSGTPALDSRASWAVRGSAGGRYRSRAGAGILAARVIGAHGAVLPGRRLKRVTVTRAVCGRKRPRAGGRPGERRFAPPRTGRAARRPGRPDRRDHPAALRRGLRARRAGGIPFGPTRATGRSPVGLSLAARGRSSPPRRADAPASSETVWL